MFSSTIHFLVLFPLSPCLLTLQMKSCCENLHANSRNIWCTTQIRCQWVLVPMVTLFYCVILLPGLGRPVFTRPLHCSTNPANPSSTSTCLKGSQGVWWVVGGGFFFFGGGGGWGTSQKCCYEIL